MTIVLERHSKMSGRSRFVTVLDRPIISLNDRGYTLLRVLARVRPTHVGTGLVLFVPVIFRLGLSLLMCPMLHRAPLASY